MYDSFYNYDYDYDYSPFYNEINPALDTSDVISRAVSGFFALLAGFAFIFLLMFVASIIVYVAKWKIFKKAGKKPWEALIPVHSTIVEFEIGGIETYWYFLNLITIIPFIGWFLGWIPIIALHFWRCIALSKSFGKGTGFGIMTALLPFIGYPVLGFSSCQYIGPQSSTNSQNYSVNSQNNYNNSGANFSNGSNNGFNMNNNITPNYTQPSEFVNNVQPQAQTQSPNNVGATYSSNNVTSGLDSFASDSSSVIHIDTTPSNGNSVSNAESTFSADSSVPQTGDASTAFDGSNTVDPGQTTLFNDHNS